MQSPRIHSKSPRGIVFLIGYVATISAVLGYDMVVCRGIFAGVLSALLRLGFLVFVSPSVLATVLFLVAFCSAVAFALGALPLFRERKELLLFVIPVAALLLGIAAASNAGIPVRCSLSPWR
ncbi:MAG TPA: hypothetical protein PKN26_13385 [Giesbergeria sp.]|nr:hypothetical protein [Giesbergeria sp.]HNE70955.1 hypothetical protein [Giesbergeria sp.]HNI76552.1 hypothetical protein [Giesbergeria sp.]HNM39939.1 hypothetical protein [Giesbergeria sp.]HNN16861.1 hypothetical protein [Giesbergeria sp.]